jgi:predicted nucleic acid-binding protein
VIFLRPAARPRPTILRTSQFSASHTHPVVERIWRLRNHVTAHDAAYIALAKALDCAVVTCDSALTIIPGLHINVELF